jgi:hypothetical protein
MAFVRVRRTFRTGVPDRIENFGDRDGSGLGRGTWCRIPASDVEGALASVRIGAILHPTVMLAFADGASFLQHGDGPASQRSNGRSAFSDHQHLKPLLTGRENPRAIGLFQLLSQGDSESPYLLHFHVFHRLWTATIIAR